MMTTPFWIRDVRQAAAVIRTPGALESLSYEQLRRLEDAAVAIAAEVADEQRRRMTGP